MVQLLESSLKLNFIQWRKKAFQIHYNLFIHCFKNKVSNCCINIVSFALKILLLSTLWISNQLRCTASAWDSLKIRFHLLIWNILGHREYFPVPTSFIYKCGLLPLFDKVYCSLFRIASGICTLGIFLVYCLELMLCLVTDPT